MRQRLSTLVLFAFSITAPLTSRAAPPSACGGRITRENVVPCALRASPWVEADRAELNAALARKTAVSPLLPANPVVSFSLARRREPSGPSVVNWHASLEQELEIGGQRGLRQRAAGAFAKARSEWLVRTRRDVAARAWKAYFEAAAAHERMLLASGLAEGARAVAAVARARAEQGLIAPVEADVAEAAAIKAWQAQLSAERERADADATLAILLGRDASMVVEVAEELTPLRAAGSRAAAQLEAQPEARAHEAERAAYQGQAEAYRRARVPNPTISVFAEDDGFNERVLGVGVALPIPLPFGVGRTLRGEIAEAEALSTKAAAERKATLREAELDLERAQRAFDSRMREREAFTPERLERARRGLLSLREEVQSGRLSVREAVMLQQALLELLGADLATRLALCLTSVDLARASGVPLELGAP